MSARAERFEAVEPHMGTLVRITVHAPDEGVARQAFLKAFERIRELDEKLSDYKSNSEVNRLSAAAPGVWTLVSHGDGRPAPVPRPGPDGASSRGIGSTIGFCQRKFGPIWKSPTL